MTSYTLCSPTPRDTKTQALDFFLRPNPSFWRALLERRHGKSFASLGLKVLGLGLRVLGKTGSGFRACGCEHPLLCREFPAGR